MALLKIQNFNGYWENLGEINAMLGLNVSKINGVDVDDQKIANKCVATILALAALHVKSMNQKNLWTMIEIKAIDWLKITLPNSDVNQLVKDTESLIN